MEKLYVHRYDKRRPTPATPQNCDGQHLSDNCPKLVQQPVDRYQYQRYPAQPVQYVPPAKSLWDACDEIDEEFVVGGIETTLPLHRRLVREPEFVRAEYDIHWLERVMKDWS